MKIHIKYSAIGSTTPAHFNTTKVGTAFRKHLYDYMPFFVVWQLFCCINYNFLRDGRLNQNDAHYFSRYWVTFILYYNIHACTVNMNLSRLTVSHGVIPSSPSTTFLFKAMYIEWLMEPMLAIEQHYMQDINIQNINYISIYSCRVTPCATKTIYLML